MTDTDTDIEIRVREIIAEQLGIAEDEISLEASISTSKYFPISNLAV